MMSTDKKCKTCKIGTRIVEYDIMTTGAVGPAKRSFKIHFKYIGSSTIFFVDGKRTDTDEVHHFFVKSFSQESQNLKKMLTTSQKFGI